MLDELEDASEDESVVALFWELDGTSVVETPGDAIDSGVEATGEGDWAPELLADSLEEDTTLEPDKEALIETLEEPCDVLLVTSGPDEVVVPSTTDELLTDDVGAPSE